MLKKEDLKKISACTPLENRVVIHRLDWGETSEGGNIIIPETAREERRLAKVIAVGPEVKTVKPGDVVLTVLYKGVDLQWGGKKVKILRESPDIMAIVTPEE